MSYPAIISGLMFAVVLSASLITSEAGIIEAGAEPAQDQAWAGGKPLYEQHCASCHGTDGKGNGPAAASLPKPATDFTNPKFWQTNTDKRIKDTIDNGHGVMPSIKLEPDQIKSIVDYMSRTFKQ